MSHHILNATHQSHPYAQSTELTEADRQDWLKLTVHLLRPQKLEAGSVIQEGENGLTQSPAEP